MRHQKEGPKRGSQRTLGEIIDSGPNGDDEERKLQRHLERVRTYRRSNGFEGDPWALEDALFLAKIKMGWFSVLLIKRQESEAAMREVAKVTELATKLKTGQIPRPKRPGRPPALVVHTPPPDPMVHWGAGQTRRPGSHRS